MATATVTIPLLNMRHNGPRGIGTTGTPVKGLRQFQKPPPDLVEAEKKKLEKEKTKLVKELRSDADLDGSLGVRGKLAKLKENDKKLKELTAWEKADATVGTTVQPKLEPAHKAQVESMKKLYELNRLEMLIKEAKKLSSIDV